MARQAQVIEGAGLREKKAPKPPREREPVASA